MRRLESLRPPKGNLSALKLTKGRFSDFIPTNFVKDYSFDLRAFKVRKFCNCQKRNSIEVLLGINNCVEERVKCANFQGLVNFLKSLIAIMHMSIFP